MKRIHQLAAAVLCAAASCAAQATTVYTNEAAFLAAAGGSLPFQSFETVQSSTDTQLNFGDVSFACNGGTWCPGFFGTSSYISHDAVWSAFFATPDTVSFTFAQPVTAFGVWIGDAGTQGPIYLSTELDNGEAAAVLRDFTGELRNWQYFGLIADTAFTSATFWGSNLNDGIYFDALHYRPAAAAVPEPSTALLLGLAGAGLLAARRKRAARR